MFVKTTCGFCFAGCGLIFRLEKGRPVEVMGDPDSPVNKGIICEKARASIEYLYHRDRLKKPLKRVGEKGEGRFKEVSWKEALEEIADRLWEIRDRWGAEKVAFIHGAAKGYQDTFLRRFSNVFGSPNIASMGHVCFLPRKYGSEVTFGYYPSSDYSEECGCVVVWGTNRPGIADHVKTMELAKRGAKLIVVDPFPTHAARESHIWLRIRPGSDIALALSMINVVISEDLYDKEFVKRWTLGFERLVEGVKGYTPEWAQEITWVDADLIREAARLYARSKPSYIRMGNALEHNPYAFQTVRAISILKAITGNLSVRGGEVYKKPVPVNGRYADVLTLDSLLPEEKRSLRLGSDQFSHFYRFSHPPSIIKAVLEEVPYPVKAAYIQGANILLTYPNAKRVKRALEKLDFLVVVDLFMTPTALFADIVLPAASFMEYDSVVSPPYYPVAQVQEGFTSFQETWPDIRIINGLAKLMGFKHFFHHEKEFLDLILAPSGMDFERFKGVRYLAGEPVYQHYVESGFNTPSGKVEIYSQVLEEMGIDPIPRFKGLDVGRGFVLTSWKSPYYRHSSMRQVNFLRRLHPEPVAYIGKGAAERLGIREGDEVVIKTNIGAIKQRAKIEEKLDDRVICADYAWWFPEKRDLGWEESNINLITDDGPPYGKELGTVTLRGFLVEVEKASNL